MYEAFYGMRHRPFAPIPQPECFVPVPHMAQALHDLEACVRREQGIAVLTAPAGAGKTLLCQRLAADLSDDFSVVHLGTARFPSRRALLQAILFELGQSYIGLSEQESRLRIFESLRPPSGESRPVLLIVDEAHLLAARFLEELRTLADHQADGHALIRIVLSGQLLLEETLSEPPLGAFNQRVGCHACLEALSADESAEYARFRLAWAETDAEAIFTPGALSLLVHAAEGNPRRINQLADHALLIGFAEEQLPVTQSTVQNALVDLRELPLHWNEPLSLSETDLMSDEYAAPLETSPSFTSDSVPEAAVFEWGADAGALSSEPETATQDAGARLEINSAELSDTDPHGRLQWPPATEDGPAAATYEYDTASLDLLSDPSLPAMFQSPFEEVVVEDRYALLDRNNESGRAVLTELPPPDLRRVESPTYLGDGSPSIDHAIEENLHNLLQSMRAEVIEAISVSNSPLYDVVEPDEDLEAPHVLAETAIPEEHLETATLPMSASFREQVEPGIDESSIPATDEAPVRRYAQLFSRLQRQRGRIESLFQRERR